MGFISSADNRAAIEASAVTNSGTLYATTVKSTGAVTNKNYGLINATGDIIVTTGNISNTSSNPTGMSAANITAQNGNIINGDSGAPSVTSQMTATGAITANGSLENNYGNIQASTMTTTGTLYNTGTINVTGDDGISAGGTITNSDDGKITAAKIVTTGINTGITNYANATMNISSELTATGALENYGKILGNSNTVVSADTITLYGTGVIEAATVTATNALTNSGRIGVESNYTIRAAVTGSSVSNEGVIYATTIDATGTGAETGTITNHNNFGYIDATGDITAEQGIINKDHALIRTTGDIISLTGDISNTSDSVAVPGESQSGYLSAVNITAQDGNIINGADGVTSQMTATGDITAGGTGDNGNITNKTNSIMTATGAIIANTNVTNNGQSMTGTSITAGHETVTQGVYSGYVLNTAGTMTANGNGTAADGKITGATGVFNAAYDTTTGVISMGAGTMNASGAITATTGNVVSNTNGDGMVGASITATTGSVTNTKGRMEATSTEGISAGNSASNGNVTNSDNMVSAGVISSTGGNVTNNTNATMDAEGAVTATNGNVINDGTFTAQSVAATGNRNDGYGYVTNNTNGTMTIDGTLVADSDITNNGTATNALSAASITAGTATQKGSVTNNYGTMKTTTGNITASNGSVTNEATMTSAGAISATNGDVTNKWNATMNAAGAVTAANGDVNNTGTFTAKSVAATTGATAGTGDVTNYAGGTMTVTDAIIADSDVTNNSITTNDDGDTMSATSITAGDSVTNNAGVMRATSAAGITANNGNVTNATGATMASAGVVNAVNGNVTNNGQSMTGTSITATNGYVLNTFGTMTANDPNGTGITAQTGIYNAGNNTGTIAGAGTMNSAAAITTATGDIVNNTNGTGMIGASITATTGSVTNVKGKMEATSADGINAGNGSVINSDTMNSAGGVIATNGSVTNKSSSTMTVTGDVQAGNDVENNGTLIAANIVADSDGTGAGGVTNGTDAIMTGDSVTGQFLTNSGALTSNDDVDIVGAMTNNEGATWNADGNVIGGSLLNNGTFNGTGNLTADTGSVTNNGTLNADGKITVEHGDFSNAGTLNAGGIVEITSGNFTNTGTMSANEIISKNLTTSGDIVTSIYSAGVGDATPVTDNDLYSANGKITVNSGNLILKDAVTGGGTFVEGDKYTVLKSGTELNVENDLTLDDSDMTLGRRLKFGTSFDELKYYVTVNAKWSYGKNASTYNQRQFGTYLDQVTDNVVGGSDLDTVLIALENLSPNLEQGVISPAARNAMAQMDGAVYGSMATMEIQNVSIVNNTLSNYLRPKNALCSDIDAPESPALNMWGTYYGVDGYASSDGNAFGGDYTVHGVLVGSDRQITSNFRLGGFFAFGNSNYDVSGLDEHADADSYKAGLYFVRNVCSGYLLGNLNYGWLNYDMTRNITFLNRANTAETSGNEWSMRIEKGFHYALGNTLLQPFGAFQYLWLKTNEFSETGGGSTALNVGKTNYNSYRSEFGARLLRGFEGQKGGLSNLYFEASWLHEFGDRYGTVTGSFNNAGGADYSGNYQYTVNGVDLGSDWCNMGLGGDWSRNNFTVFGGYDFMFSGTQNLHTGNVGLAYQF